MAGTGPAADVQRAALKRAFVAQFPEHGTISAAAKAIGVWPRSVRRWLKADPAFAAAFQEALLAFRDRVERELVRRGIEGWSEDVYQRGMKVGEIKKYSDRALELLARGWLPDRYKDHVEVSGTVAHQHQVVKVWLPDNGRGPNIIPGHVDEGGRKWLVITPGGDPAALPAPVDEESGDAQDEESEP